MKPQKKSAISNKSSAATHKGNNKRSKKGNDKKNLAPDSPAVRLCNKINYHFSDLNLLTEAITHRSKHSINNERLEFLGDSVLGYVISSELFRRFPEAREGMMTRGRAVLVKGDTLAELALTIDLGDYLQLGPGELKSGGFRRKSILADAMEAIIGAIYLDGGLEAAKQHILNLYSRKLDTLSLEDVNKDPKTQLQEKMQARKKPLPVYEIISTSGSDHDQVFEVACKVKDFSKVAKGSGRSRRKAEQAAAVKMLELLSEQDKD